MQVAAWRAAGHHVRNIVIGTPDKESPVECNYVAFPKVLKPYFGACTSTFRLRRVLSDYKPDIIYARQLLWWPGSVWALSVAPVVFEINSLTSEEYRVVSTFKYLLHFVTEKRLLGAAKGLVSVSNEIDKFLPDVSAKRSVIGNGYDFSRCITRVPPKNGRPALIFVGSSNQPWQGVDKVVRLARLIPEFDFHIVVPGFRCDGPNNVICHGGLYGNDLEKIFSCADVALGTLALHRKNMQEATPLKTREYLAYGIPVVAGYRDIDLLGTDYFFDIGNTEDNVESASSLIVEFVKNWIGRVVPYDDVSQRLDHRNKEKQRIEFFKDVLRVETQKSFTDNEYISS